VFRTYEQIGHIPWPQTTHISALFHWEYWTGRLVVDINWTYCNGYSNFTLSAKRTKIKRTSKWRDVRETWNRNR